jgi:1-phosphofructokinase family hexose kinase
MFICVSLNPAIDKRLVVEWLAPGQIHRVRAVSAYAGGKAAHVALVLRALGERPHWVAPCGGAIGQEVSAGLRALGIEVHAFPVEKTTRTNLEILENDGRVTELLEPGEAYSAEELNGFEKLLAKLFEDAGKRGIAIFSGSLPSGVSTELYKRLISLARSFGCRTILDTSGEPLRVALSSMPDLVKPNREEAEKLLGEKIASVDDAAAAARRVVALGAGSVVLSLGQDGMLYCAGKDEPIQYAPALGLKTRSAVGCGDAALAGFSKSFSVGASGGESLRLAVACASANCVADTPGVVLAEDVEKYQREAAVRVLA